VDAGAGDDTIEETSEGARPGRDALDGGEGRDRLEYRTRGRGVRVDLALGRGADADRLSGLEDVGGTQRADVLRGSARANELRGNGGNDVIDGRSGNDALLGDDGRDRLLGGRGRDELDLGDRSEEQSEELPDRALCGSGADLIRRASPGDRLGGDCERVLAEGGEPDFFAVLVSQPLRAQRSGVVELRLADPGAGERFRGRVVLRYRGLLIGRPSPIVALSPRGRAVARVDIVGPALARLTAARALAVQVVLNDIAFSTVLRAPPRPRTGTGGTPA
jgi:hypothetical protein